MLEIPEILLKRLVRANSIAILTGAGVSAESGIKTFRDPDGLWAKFNPAELASADGFMSNPELVWQWYQMRRDVIADSKPNPGHFAIAEMQKLFDDCSVITQNVDQLHQRAGAVNVIELHGNIIDNHCFDCKKPYHGETTLPGKTLPVCPYCGGRIRPSVVWFGEMLPYAALQQAEEASVRAEIFFSVGTSAEVYPAANLPYIAKQNGAFVVEVNPNKTSLTQYANVHLAAPSGEALPRMLEAFNLYKTAKNN